MSDDFQLQAFQGVYLSLQPRNVLLHGALIQQIFKYINRITAIRDFVYIFHHMEAQELLIHLNNYLHWGLKRFTQLAWLVEFKIFLKIGDLILLEGSVRGDGASRYYAPNEFPSISDFSLFFQVKSKLDAIGESYYSGLSFGTDALYRENLMLINSLKQLDVLSIDLESSALFAISRRLGLKACWAGVISDLLLDGAHKGVAHSEPVIPKLSKLTRNVLEIIESD